MQALYEWDFNGKKREVLDSALKRNLEEFAPDLDDQGFTKELVDGAINHMGEIDAMIVKYAPEWPLEQITIVDRNILRIGVFELVHSENIPSKVAINEAIEVAKTFGGESSGRFVNGVLGAIFRDRVEQGVTKKADAEERPKPEDGGKKEGKGE